MVDETIIRSVELLRLQPGDILVVDTGSEDMEEAQGIADAIGRALEHAGRQDDVSVLLHDGNIKLALIRPMDAANELRALHTELEGLMAERLPGSDIALMPALRTAIEKVES